MSNVFDYLTWRGDIPFDKLEVQPADAAVFCALSYAPLDGVVPGDCSKTIPVKEVAARVLKLAGKKGDGRTYHMAEDEKLIKKLIDAPRFADLEMTGFVNLRDIGKEEQFSAYVCLLPGDSVAVVFRGTDKTLIGWKEDFNMGFKTELPSQIDALEYLKEVASMFSGKLYLFGHSKGGNLAMYSAAFCDSEIQDRIVKVYNMDGPGFLPEIVETEQFEKVCHKIMTFIPQSSVVGMLLNHVEEHYIIHSTSVSVFQHAIYSWEIKRGEFVPDQRLTDSSILLDATLKEWIVNITPEERERLIDGVYAAITASKATTVQELMTGKSLIEAIKALSKLDEETKRVTVQAYKLFKRAMINSIPIIRKDKKEKTKYLNKA